jgi:hypothetical protein
MIQVIIKYGRPIVLAITKGGASAISWVWGIATTINWGTSTPDKLWGVPVSATVAVNTNPPSISGTAVVGQTLTATPGTWTGIATVNGNWQRNGVDIVGAKLLNYTLVQADAGNTSNITYLETATNTAGSADATSNQIAQILTVRTSAFLTASAISDATIRGGLNTFDIGMIANSLDTKMRAVYPYATDKSTLSDILGQFKFNFMNAVDTNAAYRLSFNGTSTASSNGWIPNGTNAYANTFFQASSGWTNTNSVSFGVYTRNNTATAAVMGSSENVITIPDASFLYTHLNNNLVYTATTTGAPFSSVSSIGATSGLFVVSRTASNLTTVYRNGTSIGTTVKASTGRSTIPFWLGAANFNGYVEYGKGEWAFAFIADGLSGAEASTFYTLVQGLQTTLGRNV